jgi:hypothetical protein
MSERSSLVTKVVICVNICRCLWYIQLFFSVLSKNNKNYLVTQEAEIRRIAV